ncbi:MAG: bifunctional hydroxymethylpyrimidine kinase/phosphomethylpyrimidine kinase [Halopenitus sp.]
MTDEYDPISPPVALTVAGSDSGGGAGIQADLKTMTVHDVFGTSVVTATTAQNTEGVHDVTPLPADHVAAQFDAVVDDFAVEALKTGMLATAEIVVTVTDALADFDGRSVVDPVMVAATGDRLLSPEAEAAYEDLIREATLVTPNVDEAEVLTDRDVDTAEDATAAGRDLVQLGADAALVKGGHLAGERVVDTLVLSETLAEQEIDGDQNGSAVDSAVEDGVDSADGERVPTDGADGEAVAADVVRFEGPRVDTEATHGAGCTLSSAITAHLARGEPLREAVASATRGMTDALRRGYDVGTGPGAVNPTRLVDDGRD